MAFFDDPEKKVFYAKTDCPELEEEKDHVM